MAITKEQLVAKGLDEATASASLAAVNAVLKDVLDNNYVSKQVFNEKNGALKEANNTIITLRAEIIQKDNKIKEAEGKDDEIQRLRDDNAALDTKYKDLETKYNNQADELKKDMAVREYLSKEAIDVDDVISKLDITKVVFKDGKIESGLEDQVKSLKESKPHWFKSGDGGKGSGFSFGFDPMNSNRKTDPEGNQKAVDFAKELAGGSKGADDTKNSSEKYYFG